MQRKAARHKQTFSEHVGELRKRLTWSAVVFMIGGSVGYLYHKPIIDFIKRPINAPLYYNTPAGSFNLVMEGCVLIGAIFALPVLIYNLVRFLEPAIEKRLKNRHVFSIVLLSLVLAFMGASFAYLFVLPLSLHFFQGFKIDGLNPMISAQSYMDFVFKCVLAFIFIFQIPLLILFINKIKPLSPKKLLKFERHVIVGSLIIALVLPFTYDPLTQFVIALPIVLLYNFSLLLVVLVNRKPKQKKHPVPHFVDTTEHAPVKRRNKVALTPMSVVAADVEPLASASMVVKRTEVAKPKKAPALPPRQRQVVTSTLRPRPHARPAQVRQAYTNSNYRHSGGDMVLSAGPQHLVLKPLPPRNFLDLRSPKRS